MRYHFPSAPPPKKTSQKHVCGQANYRLPNIRPNCCEWINKQSQRSFCEKHISARINFHIFENLYIRGNGTSQKFPTSTVFIPSLFSIFFFFFDQNLYFPMFYRGIRFPNKNKNKNFKSPGRKFKILNRSWRPLDLRIHSRISAT